MAIFGNGRRMAALEKELSDLRAIVPDSVYQGETVDSPYVQMEKSRSLVPWSRNKDVTEAARPERQAKAAPARAGYLADIPRGGSTEFNQGYQQVGGSTDRRTAMEQLQRLYLTCVWSNTCVDVIARTASAGGLSVVPDSQSDQRDDKTILSPQAQKAMDLIEYVNPYEDIRQLMRGAFTDLLIYGDAFIEVVWFMDEPIALYSLPCVDMFIEADEHGVVKKYIQRTETMRRAEFTPEQIIHIQFDTPRGGLYGLGPTEKTVFPITTWLFTTGLLKSTMARGNPPNVAFKWDVNLSSNEIKKFSEQYLVRNIGPSNIGNPVDLIGDTAIHEFAQSKIAEYILTRNQARDEICAGYGVPPAKTSIIEAGSLGGGTGTAQDKTFRVNTCGPIEELVLEKMTYQLLNQGFGITDCRFKFSEVDWRDDQVIENIRDLRVRRGAWTVNRDRDDINEPPTEGGDDPVIIERTGMVLVKDLAAMSQAVISGKESGKETDTLDGPVVGPDGQPPGTPTAPPVVPPVTGKPPDAAGSAPKLKTAQEMVDDEYLVEEWAAHYVEKRNQALRQIPKVGD